MEVQNSLNMLSDSLENFAQKKDIKEETKQKQK